MYYDGHQQQKLACFCIFFYDENRTHITRAARNRRPYHRPTAAKRQSHTKTTQHTHTRKILYSFRNKRAYITIQSLSLLRIIPECVSIYKNKYSMTHTQHRNTRTSHDQTHATSLSLTLSNIYKHFLFPHRSVRPPNSRRYLFNHHPGSIRAL